MEDKTCIYFIGSLKIGAVKIGRSDNPFILRELLNDDINLSKRSLGSYLKELCILGYLEHVGYNGNAKIYRHKEDDAV